MQEHHAAEEIMSDHDTEEMIKQAKKTNASPFDYTISCNGNDATSSISSSSNQSKDLLSASEEDEALSQALQE